MVRQYIEIKAKANIYPSEAKAIAAKGTIFAVLTTGTISPKAKELFDTAEIIWIEKIPEKLIMESNAKKLDLST